MNVIVHPPKKKRLRRGRLRPPFRSPRKGRGEPPQARRSPLDPIISYSQCNLSIVYLNYYR
ncbi:hypothetical protein MBAV_001602 [Candidatus Magnetobacterium bavaricum]|uniref:Uncharacterized protein n=1 Tax=Candidatus Magnetobacterium bavaricum TaxID=29290 RepID=A0A0F3GWC2_9BACT|nr:hypothetical protein MBAV_001602 [Candidatus Magnetobacterium bavaricum]